MEKILAVITDWDDANAVLSRAAKLAEQFKTQVEVLRPVSSPLADLNLTQVNRHLGADGFSSVRDSIMQEEHKRLESVCGAISWPCAIEWHAEWCKRIHQAIVERAESAGVGLIVLMASHHSVLATLVHTPDDWHLFRDAPCPVLSLVRDAKPVVRVIAAIDAFDHSEAHQLLSARVIDQARALAKAEAVPVTVLSVVPDPALLYAGFVNAPINVDFQAQVMIEAKANLADMLKRLGVAADSDEAVVEVMVEVKPGQIESVVTQEGELGGLLVIGSAANKGVKGFWIGNTAERILHHMRSDMLVVN